MHISTSWFVVVDQISIETSDFITSTTEDYQLACAAEMYGCLEDMQGIDNLFVTNNDSAKRELIIASDFLGVIRKL